MIDPVSSRSTSDLWEAYAAREAELAQNQSKVDTEDDEEVVSLWYLSSIQSLQTPAVPPNETNQTQAIDVQSSKSEQSRFQKIRSWLWGWFGGSKEPQAANTSQEEVGSIEKSTPAGLSRSPQLQPPEPMSNEHLSKAIADINKELLHRLKDSAEFAEEMRNSNDMDRLILFHLVSKSLDQKRLKEEAGMEAHEHILNLQKLNKVLHQKYYCLLEDINATAKTNTTLHWINVGATVGIVGTVAAGLVTGGLTGVFAFTLPALNIFKGGMSGAEGVLKYKNDLRTGEVVSLNHDVKANRNTINDKVNSTLPIGDEEISHLLKAIREHLVNYSKEARINPQA